MARDPEWIRVTAPHIREVRDRLFFHFGAVEDSGATVFIAPDRPHFLEALGPAFPDWGVGAAQPGLRRIHLLSPARYAASQPYAQVVKHEYAHLYLHLRAGPDATIPRWLDEGFAMHAAFEWTVGRHLRLARAAITHSLLGLGELDDVGTFGGERAALAYTEAFSAYQYLEDQYGLEGIRELLRELGNGRSMEQAFWRALGTGYPEFQAQWRADLRQRYSMLSILSDTGLWWGLLGLFIVILWLLKKRRSRDIERRWRIEDRIHGEPDFNEYVDPDDDESWRG